MNIFKRLFGNIDDRAPVRPLYAAITTAARRPHWYIEGGVADTVEGRFEMVTALLVVVLVRLEALGAAGADASVLLTEVFVEDMDGQLRESGIGDVSIGKYVGKLMSALGGRLGAYRESLGGNAPFGDALVRNLYAGVSPAAGALAHVEARLRGVAQDVKARPLEYLLAGEPM